MSKSKKIDLKREKSAKPPKAALAKRIAIQSNENGERVAVIQHTTKGYDVPMIRDFLEHLLLEVRCQQAENIKVLRGLGSAESVEKAIASGHVSTPAVIEEFDKFREQYDSALVVATVFGVENATDDESREVMQVLLGKNIARREEQIGHLEALQDLFDEALSCAKLPFGTDEQGNPVQPFVEHEVRKIVDDAFAAGLPSYDELLPQFREHPLATPEVIQQMKQYRIIMARNRDPNRDTEQDMILFGLDHYHHRSLKSLTKDDYIFYVGVRTYAELQFFVAAIHKFVGLPCTDGSPWKEMLPS
ncbi:MAG: hypothetical protein AB7I37_15665 [Pirellulales bacterium]